MIYLAAPYSHPDSKVQEERFIAVTKAAGFLMMQGEVVFSPITHGHPIAQHYGAPTYWKYWEKHGKTMLKKSRKLLILMLPGYLESAGVCAEIEIARYLDIPIEFIKPEDVNVFSNSNK